MGFLRGRGLVTHKGILKRAWVTTKVGSTQVGFLRVWGKVGIGRVNIQVHVCGFPEVEGSLQ